MSLVETQSARAQQLSSYSGHTLWLDSTFIWQPYLDRSFLPIQIWVRLKFLFLFELELWHDFIQLLYIYFIRDFFPILVSRTAAGNGAYILNCSLNSKSKWGTFPNLRRYFRFLCRHDWHVLIKFGRFESLITIERIRLEIHLIMFWFSNFVNTI